jgi:hypothetical protein
MKWCTNNGEVIALVKKSLLDGKHTSFGKRLDVWLHGSNGTVYVLYPEDWQTPTVDVLGSW